MRTFTKVSKKSAIFSLSFLVKIHNVNVFMVGIYKMAGIKLFVTFEKH